MKKAWSVIWKSAVALVGAYVVYFAVVASYHHARYVISGDQAQDQQWKAEREAAYRAADSTH